MAWTCNECKCLVHETPSNEHSVTCSLHINNIMGRPFEDSTEEPLFLLQVRVESGGAIEAVRQVERALRADENEHFRSVPSTVLHVEGANAAGIAAVERARQLVALKEDTDT